MKDKNLAPKLLLVDDDIELCELLSEYLQTEGFLTDCLHDGLEAVKLGSTGKYDLIILDVMLPTMNGLQVLKEVQSNTDTPILMLTARGDDTSRIIGLEIGADDYLAKPCNPRELVARIRAVLRRTKVKRAATPKEFESVSVDDIGIQTHTRTFIKAGEIVELTNSEYNILLYLMENVGQVIHKNELYQQAFGREYVAYDRTLDMHISNLRAKLAKNKKGQHYIQTVRGIGYIIRKEDA
jgi:two-component system response regulator CpxR